MRPFIIDNTLKEALTRIEAYAKTHIYTEADAKSMIAGTMRVPGDMEEHRVVAPFGYKIVLSWVEQKGTTYRFLSMSVDTAGKLPNPVVVKEVMGLLGFKNKLEDCYVEEEILPMGMKAIRVLEEL